MSSEMNPPPRRASGTVVQWLLLLGVGIVVGPAAVLLTAAALSWLVLDRAGGALVVIAGIVAFFGVAVVTWYGAGRLAGALTLRFGGSPFTALGLVGVPVLVLGAVAVWSADGGRVLIGIVVFLVNAMVLVVLGIRAAEQAAIRRLRDPGAPGRGPSGGRG